MELTIIEGRADGAASELTLALAGRATIAEAGKIKEALLAAFDGCSGLLVDVGEVTVADPSLFQLIEAARRMAEDQGKRFALVNDCSAAFRDAAMIAGFQAADNNEIESV